MSTFVETGEDGSQLVVVDDPGAIVGRRWARNEPAQNAADAISVGGVMSIAHDPRGELVEAVLVVSTLSMDTPSGWRAATDTMTFDELTDNYHPMSESELTVIRAEAAAKALALAADAAADPNPRISPWRRA